MKYSTLFLESKAREEFSLHPFAVSFAGAGPVLENTKIFC